MNNFGVVPDWNFVEEVHAHACLYSRGLALSLGQLPPYLSIRTPENGVIKRINAAPSLRGQAPMRSHGGSHDASGQCPFVAAASIQAQRGFAAFCKPVGSEGREGRQRFGVPEAKTDV